VYVTALAVDELFVDHTYQRDCEPARARAYARAWDRRLAGIIEVSDRGEHTRPRFAIIDGQHRWAAARLLPDPPQLVANVHENLCVAEEAILFDKLNRSRKVVGAYGHWKARRAAGDEQVHAIEKVLVKHGLRVDPAPKDGNIGCLNVLEKIEKIDIALLDETFELIVSVWGKRRDAFDGPIVHGLALILHTLRTQVDVERLVDALLDVLPRQLVTQAVALRDIQSGVLPVLTATVITGLYNRKPGPKIAIGKDSFSAAAVRCASFADRDYDCGRTS
jgi:hypothetical protein